MFGSDFVGARFRKVRHSGIIVAEVYLREALIEKNFGRIKFEFESQLFVIAGDKRASARQLQVPRSWGYAAAEEASFSRFGCTHIASFPLKYSNESSKSLKARSNRSNRKLETPHWK